MKNIIILMTTILLVGCIGDRSNTSNEEDIPGDTISEKADSIKKKVLSPNTFAMAILGDAHIHIDYSSPRVRNRIIFGGLVAFDQIWQSGAHKATWIETNKDLLIAGKTLPAGKYGFFTIPSKEGDWTLILNKKWDQHGKDEYDEKDDVLRFKVSPVLSEEIQENLEYKVIKSTENSGSISLVWEKVTINFPFEVK